MCEQTDQLSRIKSAATSPITYGNLVYDKGGISNYWGDEKIKLNPFPKHTLKQNETTQALEENTQIPL